MAAEQQRFQFLLPPVDSLLFMQGREKEVEAQVQALNLVEYTNAYTDKFHEGLVTLLCAPAASALVRKYWVQHHSLGGTPMVRQTLDKKDGLSFEPLHQLLSTTGSVVWGVLKELNLDPKVQMDTKLPPGPYIYCIGFEGEAVIKVGKVTISDPSAPAAPPSAKSPSQVVELPSLRLPSLPIAER